MTTALDAKVDSRPSGVQPYFRDKKDHEFYEYILNDIPDMDLNLFKEITDYGIENVDQWEDAYVQSMRTSIHVEAQFTEQLMDDLGYLSWDGPNEGPLPDFVLSHIDWQEVWDCELRHDYFTIEDGEYTHFFSRHF